MKHKNNFACDVLFICICAFLALFLGVGIFLLPIENLSEQENRVLSPLPSLSAASVLDGSFFSSLSAFYSDHIPLRSEMIRTRAASELLFAKRQVDGVIFGDDGVLTDRAQYSDTSLLYKNLSAIESFASMQEVNIVIVPRSVDVRYPQLEQSTAVSDLCDRELLSRLRELCAKNQDPYYKTDHHLNSIGTYALYERLAVSLGYSPREVQEQRVSAEFFGSIYSKAGLLPSGGDELVLLRYKEDTGVRVKCFDTACTQSTLYSFEYLEKKDKYSVFIGGNHGLLEVSDGEQKPRLLIIKDSFANAVLPLLVRHYDICAVDPRYYEGSISELAINENFDRILVLFGADTLATTAVSKSFLI